MTVPELEVEGLRMVYGDHPPVLDGVNFSVRTGELACLLGPSGSGKTTLLRAVAGFEKAEGEVRVGGVPVSGPSRDRVVVFQDAGAALFPWLSVRENVAYASPEGGRAAVDDLLELVGLAGQGHKRIHQISGGMRQRTQLARAFAARPRMLLMDEPFGALDALTRMEMQRELGNIVASAQMTVLFVTHDVLEAAILGDTAIVLSRGPAARVLAVLDNPVSGTRQLRDPRVTAFSEEILGHIVRPTEVTA